MGKPPQIIAHTKLVFFILLHQTVIENVRLFVMQLVFMYEIGKYPNTAGVNHGYVLLSSIPLGPSDN